MSDCFSTYNHPVADDAGHDNNNKETFIQVVLVLKPSTKGDNQWIYLES